MLQLNYPWLRVEDTKEVFCCLCGGANKTQDVFSFTINDKLFVIRYCEKDSIMFLFPQPGQKYLESLYNHPTYFQGQDDMYGLKVDEKKSEDIAKIRMEEIKKYKPSATSILEIGCGYGHTLGVAQKSGFKIVNGLEFSKRAVEICQQKGLDVQQMTNNKIAGEFKEGLYDVVAMYSVLEHLSNPLEFANQLETLVAPGGILVIRVPEMSPSGPWLSLLDHLWHFTRQSLGNLVHGTGFEVLDIFSSGKFFGIQHGDILQNITVVANPKL